MKSATGVIVPKLQHWDRKSAVRTKPKRLLEAEEEQGRVYFSPELVAIAHHPAVEGLGPEAIRAMQIQHLYRYLDFTTQLELEVINTASKDIALGKHGFQLPDVMRREAFMLCTDEAHHAYFSDDMKRQVIAASRVAPAELGTPQFLDRLRRLQADLPGPLEPLGELLFTVVSETLISSILAQIPKDGRVVSAVRQIVADHAEDEGRHSAYFAQLFGYLWPQLSAADRAELGTQLPHYILAFLAPDRGALGRALATLPLAREEIRTVIEETYPVVSVASNARDAARVTLRLFEYHGVFDDHRIGDEFRACGLI